MIPRRRKLGGQLDKPGAPPGAVREGGARVFSTAVTNAADSVQLAERLERVEQTFGYVFVDKGLLDRALTHRSVVSSAHSGDYERLEFLGDAVLDLAIAHLLSEFYPGASEGELSKMRAALVNTQCLADMGRQVQIGSAIRLSKGETGGADREALLADVIEAIFGAIYRDAGYDKALEVVRRMWSERLASVSPRDPKTELQERLHVLKRGAPEYRLEVVEGPEHQPVFVSVVMIDGEIFGRGRGPSKKVSQQDAAAIALGVLDGPPGETDPEELDS